MAKTLVVLERNNGWYGGYEKTKNGCEQLFNTDKNLLFWSVKKFTDKGYKLILLDKSQEDEFMKNRTTLDEYLKGIGIK